MGPSMQISLDSRPSAKVEAEALVSYVFEPEKDQGTAIQGVIADLDRDGRRIPESGDVDLARGELDSILNEVGEPVHDLGAASNQRLFTRGLAGRREDQPHPLITVG